MENLGFIPGLSKMEKRLLSSVALSQPFVDSAPSHSRADQSVQVAQAVQAVQVAQAVQPRWCLFKEEAGVEFQS